MHVTTLYNYFGRGCIEIFKFQLTYLSSIHCISPFTTKLFHIKLMSTQPNFFIRIETYPNLSMFNFGMLFQINHRSNDFCNTGLIVSSQQRLSIGYNQIFSFVVQQFREPIRRKNNILFLTQDNIRTVITINDTRSHSCTGHIRTGIHVSNKSYRWYRFVGICRQGSKKITILVQ